MRARSPREPVFLCKSRQKHLSLRPVRVGWKPTRSLDRSDQTTALPGRHRPLPAPRPADTPTRSMTRPPAFARTLTKQRRGTRISDPRILVRNHNCCHLKDSGESPFTSAIDYFASRASPVQNAQFPRSPHVGIVAGIPLDKPVDGILEMPCIVSSRCLSNRESVSGSLLYPGADHVIVFDVLQHVHARPASFASRNVEYSRPHLASLERVLKLPD